MPELSCERRTAKALYAEIRAAGYAGGYTRVTDFIRAWRQAEGQGAAVIAFIPLAFELGEACQFDWSEEGLVAGGIYYRAQVPHTKLCVAECRAAPALFPPIARRRDAFSQWWTPISRGLSGAADLPASSAQPAW